MGKSGIQVVHAAVFGVCWAAMNTALAVPPSHARGPRSETVHVALHPHLDLRPSASGVTTSAEAAPAAFPSALHRPSMAAPQEFDLPAMGADRAPGRVPSHAEEFARRVRHEGLPLARLWENKSALLSLGLNKKGKPGLWLVQKIR